MVKRRRTTVAWVSSNLQAVKGNWMKQCPDCSTKNQRTNLFCPTCGHSFLDEPPPPRKRPPRQIIPGEDNRRLFMIVAIVIVVVLGLAAGLTSYIVIRQLDKGSHVVVSSGVRWKCVKCGKVYKDQITSLSVPKSQKDDYGVAEAEGLCATCKYGEMVGAYQDTLTYMARKGYFHGFGIDLTDAAATFIGLHPALFGAADVPAAAAVSAAVDPRLIVKDFKTYAGKPVRIDGTVQSVQNIKLPTGGKTTYLQLKPIWNKSAVDLEYLVVYSGATQVKAGTVVDCYMLPTDVVTYGSKQGQQRAVLGIAMALKPE
jgi:hypothetical protein